MMSFNFQILAPPKPLQPNARIPSLSNKRSPHAQNLCNQNTRKQRRGFLAITAKVSVMAPEGDVIKVERVQFPEELCRESMPRHVAIIMDGNGKWAQQHGLQVSSGHEAGSRSLREIMKLCREWGVRVLTVFTFSLDNWFRPKEEVDFMMSLIEEELKNQLDNFVSEGTRVSVIGDTSNIPKSLQRTISDVEEMTRSGNSGFHFIIAISYSGTYDVAQACKVVAQKVKDGVIQVEDINESTIEQELQTKCCEFPCPDLLIRTSGELRIRNFLQWQSAYSELFFAKALWPDFGQADFVEALTSYQRRQRRYGRRYS